MGELQLSPRRDDPESKASHQPAESGFPHSPGDGEIISASRPISFARGRSAAPRILRASCVSLRIRVETPPWIVEAGAGDSLLLVKNPSLLGLSGGMLTAPDILYAMMRDGGE